MRFNPKARLDRGQVQNRRGGGGGIGFPTPGGGRGMKVGGGIATLIVLVQDVQEALDAARAVGDDRIQQRTSGRVDPDQWTHGSAEQRMRWFSVG